MKFINSKMTTKFLTLLMIPVFLLSCKSKTEKKETTEMPIETEMPLEATGTDFKISLAQWSLHKSFFGSSVQDWDLFRTQLKEDPESVLQGDLDPMDFPAIAAGYGINSIELVNTFYYNKADDQDFLNTFKQKCEDAGVSVGLIMCDGLGNLGDADADARMAAVENHYKWVDAAKFLGAHSIRVNAAGQGTEEELATNAADGLSKLGEYGASKGINIIVENHGGYSSNGKWLSGVMETVGMDNVGTLPDFGNFCIERGPNRCKVAYDRYQGMTDLMPFAKGVSAKSNAFDDKGDETKSDFLRIMKIVKASGFKGYVGIEYEGSELSEDEGIKATKALLDRVFKAINE